MSEYHFSSSLFDEFGRLVRRNASFPFVLEFLFTITLSRSHQITIHWKEIEEQVLLMHTHKHTYTPCILREFQLLLFNTKLSKMLKWQRQIHYVDSTMNLIHFSLLLLSSFHSFFIFFHFVWIFSFEFPQHSDAHFRSFIH